MRLIHIFLITGLLCASSPAGECPFQIIDPTGVEIKDTTKIDPHLLPLVEALKDPKEMSFIKAEGTGGPRQWLVQKVTMVTSAVAAVVFTEGHVEVVGIYRRRFKPARWDLVAEIDGVFSERSYRDPPVKKDR